MTCNWLGYTCGASPIRGRDRHSTTACWISVSFVEQSYIVYTPDWSTSVAMFPVDSSSMWIFISIECKVHDLGGTKHFLTFLSSSQSTEEKSVEPQFSNQMALSIYGFTGSRWTEASNLGVRSVTRVSKMWGEGTDCSLDTPLHSCLRTYANYTFN